MYNWLIKNAVINDLKVKYSQPDLRMILVPVPMINHMRNLGLIFLHLVPNEMFVFRGTWPMSDGRNLLNLFSNFRLQTFNFNGFEVTF